MIKKISILLLVFLLSSCFSSDNNETKKTNLLKKIDRKDFSISIPGTWETLKSNSSIFPKPAHGEIIFDAVSKKKIDEFYRNVLVLKERLNIKINSLEYIISNYVGAKKNYYYIKDIKAEKVLIDNKKTKIYYFEARYSEDTPIAKFLQTGIVCNEDVYIITLTLEKNNKNLDRYARLLRSFKCKVAK